jgi:hypothetical protein
MLVNGTKEKNSAVKSTSESALVAVLHLRNAEDKSGQKKCLDVLDSGARDALSDVIVKVSSNYSVKFVELKKWYLFVGIVVDK